jgi:iron complex outermembrane receptor protein
MLISLYRGRISHLNLHLALLAGTALLSSPATAVMAADQVPADAAAPEPAPDSPAAPNAADNVIIVTGARTGTTEFQSSSPISVVGAERLHATSQPDLRNALGSVAPSFIAVQSSNGSSSSKPVRAASLRALSGFHTLVLVDGVRRHNTALLNNTGGSTAGAPADLSFIPLDAVDHIEVLSDGASAQYGSDAIAGVVNIILKKGHTGGTAYAQAGYYDTEAAHVGGLGDRGFTQLYGISQGFEIGRGGAFINITADYRKVEDSNDIGPIRTPAAGDALSHIFAYNGVGLGDPREFSTNRYRQLWEVVPFGWAWNIAANGEVPLGTDITLYANGTYGKNSLSSTGTYRSENNVATILGAVPEGGYVPTLNTRQEDYQFTAGLKGKNLAGFDWDLSYSNARNTGNMYVNGINASWGGAHPYHVFYIGELQVGQHIVDLNLTRELDVGWGYGPIQLALGAEYRHERFHEGEGEEDSYSNGGFIFPSNYPSATLRNRAAGIGSPFMTGFRPDEAGSWNRDSYAGYIDISQDITRRLHLGVAGRFEHFSDFGSRVLGKASVRYEFADGFAIRGTINNSFRAPSLAEQYTTVVNQGPSVVNGVSIQQDTYNSIRYDAPAAQALGAQALKPETSLNFSAGFVARPVANLNLSVDAYQINIHDRIALTGAFNPNSTDTVTATAIRNALVTAGLSPTLNVQYFANIGNTRSRGLEGKINYNLDTDSLGDFNLNVALAYNQQRVTKVNVVPKLASAGLLLLQRAGRTVIENGFPNWFVKGSLDWTKGVFNVHLQENFYSGTSAVNANYPTDARYNTVSPARAITDVAISVTSPQRIKLTIGANNLLNVRANNSPAITLPQQTVGATYPLPVSAIYGPGGRFLYARVGFSW